MDVLFQREPFFESIFVGSVGIVFPLDWSLVEPPTRLTRHHFAQNDACTDGGRTNCSTEGPSCRTDTRWNSIWPTNMKLWCTLHRIKLVKSGSEWYRSDVGVILPDDTGIISVVAILIHDWISCEPCVDITIYIWEVLPQTFNRFVTGHHEKKTKHKCEGTMWVWICDWTNATFASMATQF